MKFNVDRDALLKEIEIAQEIISRKNAISILSNVFIEASFGGMLTIRATDIQISFEASIHADVAEAGATTVFCEELAEILISCPAGEISFLNDGENTTIKPLARRAFFLVKATAADKWLEACAARCPCIESSQDVEFFDIPARSLKRMISHTVFAVSNDEFTRLNMTGVFMEKDGGFLKFVATDGRRLAVISTKIEGAFPDFGGALIPANILKIIAKTCSNEDVVSIGISEKFIFFRFGSYEFSAILIPEQFPDYRRIIPEEQKHFLLVSRNDLVDVLKRVSILASKHRTSRLCLGISEGNLKINVLKDEVAVAGEEVDCYYEGEDFKIGINCFYLEEIAEAMETCEKIRIEFTDPGRVITVKGEGEDDFFHLIMPMQLD